MSFTAVDTLNTPAGQGEFNKFLADHAYVNGFTASQSDVNALAAVGKAPDANKLPHLARWYAHINFFGNDERNQWPGEKKKGSKCECGPDCTCPKDNCTCAKKTAAPAPAAAPAKKEETVNADELDLFGEDTEDEAREREIMKTAAEHAAKKKAAGKVVVAKSLVVLDVKPWDDTTDMKEMEDKVRSIEIEGLEWKASKLVAIGYGIKKLQISCNIVDDLVSVDDIQEKIQEFEDLVQSTDVSSFSKL